MEFFSRLRSVDTKYRTGIIDYMREYGIRDTEREVGIGMASHIVILGAGYAGLVCALETRKKMSEDDAKITLVNKHNYHQLITQLHETAVGARTDRATRISLPKLLQGKDIDFVKASVQSIHPEQKMVRFTDGETITYDFLVVALGSETEYFGVPGMREHAFTLKSLNQARLIRAHIESCFARYPLERKESLLRFVVGGAGFSGIELVGEFADAMPKFAAEAGIDYSLVEIYNVEAMPGILPGFDPELVAAAEESLKSRGVRFLTGTPIVGVEPGRVLLKTGDVIETETLVWTGGVRGNQIVVDAGFETEPRGRAKVDAHLCSVNYPDVYILGDSALVLSDTGRPMPPTAQIAWEMGSHAARSLLCDVRGGVKEAFQPVILGSIASLGRHDSVGKVFSRYRLYGRTAHMAKGASQMRYLAKIGAVFNK